MNKTKSVGGQRSEMPHAIKTTTEKTDKFPLLEICGLFTLLTASEAKLMETFAECQFFLSKIDIFFAAGANSGHCCNESSARVCDRDSGKLQILKSEKSKFPI